MITKLAATGKSLLLLFFDNHVFENLAVDTMQVLGYEHSDVTLAEPLYG